MEVTTIQNASRIPQIYYGLHMVPGVAEYRDPGKEPLRILVSEETIKAMDPSFKGRPVYVNHVDEVNLDKIQAEADGYVVKSFFNKADGMHWAEFLAVSDEAHNAIAKGWKLSNAYIPKAKIAGGMCNGVDYQEEITAAEYEHLAIVPNPRYEQSRILTPEQFKTYNSEKELELQRLSNSKDHTKQGAPSMKFNFFKTEKVENSAELEGMSVTLPVSKKRVTLEKLINDADAIEEKGAYANGKHMVNVGDEEMTVNELVEKCLAMMKAVPAAEASPEDKFDMHNKGEKDAKKNKSKKAKKNDEEDEEAREKALELAEHEEEEIEEEEGESLKSKKNKAKAKKNAAEEELDDEEFDALLNAGPTPKEAPAPFLLSDGVALGKELFTK